MLQPDWAIDSIFSITPEQLQQKGFTSVLVDLDNTLLAWYDKTASVEMIDWITALQNAGMQVIVISNNTQKRVQTAVGNLTPYVYSALKPSSKGLKQAMALSQADDKSQVVLIGDQLLTDVLSAKLFGIASIFVQPLVASDNIYTKINRQIEKIFLRNIKWRETLE